MENELSLTQTVLAFAAIVVLYLISARLEFLFGM